MKPSGYFFPIKADGLGFQAQWFRFPGCTSTISDFRSRTDPEVYTEWQRHGKRWGKDEAKGRRSRCGLHGCLASAYSEVEGPWTRLIQGNLMS
ncbi:hypothetical protein SUGI_0290100 [Cryptomeria japonica]|nr:hypothetical protein SUGI_0290100 [Cryptomeria japonica]